MCFREEGILGMVRSNCKGCVIEVKGVKVRKVGWGWREGDGFNYVR